MSTAYSVTPNARTGSLQFTTFYLGEYLFGIDVTQVQEVTGHLTLVPVPLAPKFVRGLINLRGQIATALGLRELFNTGAAGEAQGMLVVCRIDGNLVSLIVDSIGDVVAVESRLFEQTPDTIPVNLKKYVKGIYKLNDALLSVVDLEAIAKELTPANEAA